MKIYNSKQIKEWDAYTVQHEQIASIDLMERAALACCQWLSDNILSGSHLKIFCGKGNNGGDGLAIARILIQNGLPTSTYIIDTGSKESEGFKINHSRLQSITNDITLISTTDDFPQLHENNVIVDALFGMGLSKPMGGIAASFVEYLNSHHHRVISIDLPSGLFPDKTSKGNKIVKASDTLTFQVPKLCFILWIQPS